jgi:RHS repeat-associated protein
MWDVEAASTTTLNSFDAIRKQEGLIMDFKRKKYLRLLKFSNKIFIFVMFLGVGVCFANLRIIPVFPTVVPAKAGIHIPENQKSKTRNQGKLQSTAATTSHIPHPISLFATAVTTSHIPHPTSSSAAATIYYIPHPTSSDSSVGSIPGKLNVSPSGAASYSIDINVPPGTAGITPALSVAYNSQQSNGLLGVGFSLQGLTAITRAPSNLAQNGEKRGVDYTDADKFAFNGQQLVAVGGQYGRDGAEYRAYADAQTKIVSYGRQGDGPEKFKVWAKGGQVAEYAYTEDSQNKAQGQNTIATWALNKIEDTAGNYLQIHYWNNHADGSFYPKEIDYTAHETNNNVDQAPYNKVEFIYEDRPDVQVKYHAGSKNTLDKRLKEIKVYVKSSPDNNNYQLVRGYYFTYEQSPNTNRSRLSNIQECDSNGSCFKPTKFTWTTSAKKGWEQTEKFILPVKLAVFSDDTDEEENNGVQFVDLNGNGLTDILYQTPYGSGKDAWINDGNGVWGESLNYKPQSANRNSNGEDNGMRLVDLTGNGLLDMVQNSDSGSGAWINTGSGWQPDSNFIPPVQIVGNHDSDKGMSKGVQFVDLIGNGRVDIVQYSEWGEKGTWINDGKKWNKTNDYQLPVALTRDHGKDNGVRFIDITGNGLVDIVQNNADTRAKGAWLNDGRGHWVESDGFIPQVAIVSHGGKDNGVRLVDLTGDGLPDMVQNSSWGEKGAWINTGKKWIKDTDAGFDFIPRAAINHGDGKDNGVRFVDLSGNGLPDMLWSLDANNNGVWLNTGKGWISDSSYKPFPSFALRAHGATNWARFVDLNGTGKPDIIEDGATYVNRINHDDLLSSIKDGLGSQTTITYKPLTDKTIYTKEYNAVYPNADMTGPMYVVAQTSGDTDLSDPTALSHDHNQHVTSYHYAGAKVNHLDFGYLGFHKVTTTDETTGIYVTTTYSQAVTKHSQGKPLTSETHLKNGTLISVSNNIYDLKTFGSGKVNDTYYMTYLKHAIEEGYNLKGQLLSTKTTDVTIDDYADPIKTAKSATDGTGTYSTTTENTYINDTAHWFLGEVTKAKVITRAPNADPITRTSAFEYDANNGMLAKTITEPDDPNYTLIKKVERDNFGNITKTTVSGKDVEPKVTVNKYDDNGRFVIQTINALGQSTYQTVNAEFGKPTQATDLNGLKTTYKYDGFGRLIQKTNPDGTQTKVQYSWYDHYSVKDFQLKDPLRYAVYLVTTYESGKPPITKYYDKLNRQVANTTNGFDGQTIWQTTQYDDLGRATKQSKPYYAGNEAYYSTVDYDVLGRVIKTTNANGGIVMAQYGGLSPNGGVMETTINPLNQSATKITNVRGKLIETIDHMNNHTYYNYDSYGNLIKITDNVGNVSTIKYDRLGRKVAMHDFDKGDWNYEYDVLGELVSQADANKQTTTFKYNKLGQMISRTDSGGTSVWIYGSDPSQHNVGQLIRVDGVASAKKGEAASAPTALDLIRAARDNLVSYSRINAYDEYGRSSTTTINLNEKNYTTKISYDDYSRPSLFTYPDGFKIRKYYNKNSYPIAIVNENNNLVYQLVYTMDAEGHVTCVGHDNGLITKNTYDPRAGFLIHIETRVGEALKLQQQLLPFTNLNHKTLNHEEHEEHEGREENYNLTANNHESLSVVARSLRRSNPVAATTPHIPHPTSSFFAVIPLLDRGIQKNKTQINTSTVIPAKAGIHIPENQESKTRDRGVPQSRAATTSHIQNLEYQYDDLGQIKQRNDKVLNNAETFQYDDLNRLTGWDKTSSLSAVIPLYSIGAEHRPDRGTQKNKPQMDTSTVIPAKAGIHIPENQELKTWNQGVPQSRAATTSHIQNPTSSASSYQYNSLGNITYKSGLGYYHYSKINAGAHAVTSITDDVGNTVATFKYDNDGNQVDSTIKGKHRAITYTSFGKPKQITTNGAQVNFYYNADRSRFERVDKVGNKITTTLYLGDYVVVTHTDGADVSTELKHYIGSDALLITNDKGGDAKTYYLLKDNIGSITEITDAIGNVIQRYRYTPFGEQEISTVIPAKAGIHIPENQESKTRNQGVPQSRAATTSHILHPTSSLSAVIPLLDRGIQKNKPQINTSIVIPAKAGIHIPVNQESKTRNQGVPQSRTTTTSHILHPTSSASFPITHRGFTGHEEVESVSLIHMNGRMYDPVVGRFLSADPTIQAPDNSQSLNRYTYCLNNPLAFTDPSGYSWLSDFFNSIGNLFQQAGHAVQSMITNQYAGPLLEIAIGALAVASGNIYWLPALYNVSATLIAGGSIEDALKAGAITEATVLAWQITGTQLGELPGSGVKEASLETRVAVHGLVGGTLSGIEGHGFKNGFLAAAVGEATAGPIGNLGKDGDAFAGMLERSAASGIVGGTVAAATGGNFVNGARTAAFAQLFNEEAHARIRRQTGRQYAMLVKRPLDIHGVSVIVSGYPVEHWAIKMPDGRIVGYYDDSTVKSSDSLSKWYQPKKFGRFEMEFDAKTMNRALQVVTAQWNTPNNPQYDFRWHNCHDFVDASIKEYQHEGGEIKWERWR